MEKAKFEMGQTALDVCKTLLKRHPEIDTVYLTYYEVVREEPEEFYTSVPPVIANLVNHDRFAGRTHAMVRDDFLRASLRTLNKRKPDQICAMQSRVLCMDGQERHIPMMYFVGKDLKVIRTALEHLYPGQYGVLLETTQSSHYYGDRLISQHSFLKSIYQCLLIKKCIDPRYIGHVLLNGYTTLRLNINERHFETTVPVVNDILLPQDGG